MTHTSSGTCEVADDAARPRAPLVDQAKVAPAADAGETPPNWSAQGFVNSGSASSQERQIPVDDGQAEDLSVLVIEHARESAGLC